MEDYHKIYLYSKENIEECLRDNNFVNIECSSALSENLRRFNKEERMLLCKSNSF